MRTNIDIDKALLAAAMRVTGLSTKKATVEEALRSLIEVCRQKDSLDKLYGIGWEGDLGETREGREP